MEAFSAVFTKYPESLVRVVQVSWPFASSVGGRAPRPVPTPPTPGISAVADRRDLPLITPEQQTSAEAAGADCSLV